MLPIKRKEQIIQILNTHKEVSVNKLTDLFNVSEETVRKDLVSLESEGLLKRTYGGALSVERDKLIDLYNMSAKNATTSTFYNKSIDYLIPLIPEEASLFLDSHAANINFIEKYDASLVVVTNALDIAHHLNNKPTLTTFFIGGHLYKGQTLNHPNFSFSDLTVDLIFLYPDGVDEQLNFYFKDEIKSMILEQMIHCAKEIYVIIRSTKYLHKAIHKIELTKPYTVITCDNDKKLANLLKSNQISTVVV